MPTPTLRFRPLKPAVACDAASSLDLLISVVPPPAPATTTKRPPLNLALVIDRSGSMAGTPLSQARKAARFLARELSPADRLAIVVFDHEAEVLMPSMQVNDPELFVHAINSIETRGATDLQLGWCTGAMQVAEHLDPKAVNRVLLLSDGHTNHGITDADVIAQQVQGLSQNGVSTSAFGLGGGFDEDLMAAIASGGDGTLAFIDNPKQLPDLYANELSGLTKPRPAAQPGIRTRNGAELIDVLNDLPQTAFGNWQLPNLRFSQSCTWRSIQLPAWGANAEIASLRLAWERPGESERQSTVEMLSLPVMPADEIADMAVDPVVAEQFALMQANRDRQQAIAALDADDLEAAEQCLMSIDEHLAAMLQRRDQHRAPCAPTATKHAPQRPQSQPEEPSPRGPAFKRERLGAERGISKLRAVVQLPVEDMEPCLLGTRLPYAHTWQLNREATDPINLAAKCSRASRIGPRQADSVTNNTPVRPSSRQPQPGHREITVKDNQKTSSPPNSAEISEAPPRGGAFPYQRHKAMIEMLISGAGLPPVRFAP